MSVGEGFRILVMSPILFGAISCFAAAATLPEERSPEGTPDRIVAVGDVHGDYETFTELLSKPEVGIIDQNGEWAGGDAHFVMTGDLLDRGSYGFQIIEHLMRLEPQAARAGGAVTVLQGNHEVMNLTVDWRFVSAAEYMALAPREDLTLRRIELGRISNVLSGPKSLLLDADFYQDFARDRAESAAIGEDPESQPWPRMDFDRARLMKGLGATYPRGYFLRLKLLSPQGKMGRWLLRKAGIAKVGTTLFMHGGLSPRWAQTPAQDIALQMKRDLRDYFAAVDDLEAQKLFHPALGYELLRRLTDSEMDLWKKNLNPSLAQSRVHDRFERLSNVLGGPNFGGDGPLWYRGLATEKKSEEDEKDFESLLEFQGVNRMVVGHTITPGHKIESRFRGKKLWMIDVGMSRAMDGSPPQALEIMHSGTANEKVRVLP